MPKDTFGAGQGDIGPEPVEEVKMNDIPEDRLKELMDQTISTMPDETQATLTADTAVKEEKEV